MTETENVVCAEKVDSAVQWSSTYVNFKLAPTRQRGVRRTGESPDSSDRHEGGLGHSRPILYKTTTLPQEVPKPPL